MIEPREHWCLEAARVGRLATADAAGQPHVVPVCFALVDDQIVTPIDEKPQDVPPDGLRRSHNVRENPRVAFVVDHYEEDWSNLGWVQVRGTATQLQADDSSHGEGVIALQEKYDQYATHALDERPIIRLSADRVRSWGAIDNLRDPTSRTSDTV